MMCPNCQHETVVLQSRLAPGNVFRRRRRCKRCEYMFTTYETVMAGDRLKLAVAATAVREEMAHLITLLRQLDELAKGLEVQK
jgi:transcriptional regulator NrdR family protein